MRRGILVAGNWIVDQVKIIDRFPEEEKLVNILSECKSNGGSAYNIVKDLVKLQCGIPLSGIGLVGNDNRGRQIIKDCLEMGVDVSGLIEMEHMATSYTDVMTVQSTGKRTFFHERGANALLDIEHFDFTNSNAKLFHLGYLLLLDALDVLEDDGLTRAAKVLRNAQSNGMLTSVDIVSEKSERFKDMILPALPYVDFLFVNEFEAEMITGISTTNVDGKVEITQCYDAAKALTSCGVNQWVVIHFPEGAIAVNALNGTQLFQPSLKVPEQLIAGAVGAGDAFAAGVLLGLHNNDTMEHALKLGVCVAASNLFASTSSDGVLPHHDCLALGAKYGYRD